MAMQRTGGQSAPLRWRDVLTLQPSAELCATPAQKRLLSSIAFACTIVKLLAQIVLTQCLGSNPQTFSVLFAFSFRGLLF
jgi:hypothetical protein